MSTQTESTLKKNLDFFIENQAQLVSQYNGKVLLIKDQQVVGAFDEPLAAYFAALEKYEPGSFSLQPCRAGEGAYSVTISSIVSIP